MKGKNTHKQKASQATKSLTVLFNPAMQRITAAIYGKIPQKAFNSENNIIKKNCSAPLVQADYAPIIIPEQYQIYYVSSKDQKIFHGWGKKSLFKFSCTNPMSIG
ncbi:LOW QUALITY PROTEIN: hypothetical protein MXB_3279 [Myxobolus squamalis]|nr:LOW QUALITY PROTEIN: hypothetical protein MXB_3279 [Myxobolus squamalis]